MRRRAWFGRHDHEPLIRVAGTNEYVPVENEFADGGMVERAERFIIALVGAGLAGLGVPFALDVALWALAVLQLVTVAQRMRSVRRSAQQREAT